MIPLNLLLLPLLGGFIFVSRWNQTRFVVLRSEGYRLLFHSAVAGISLLFVSATIVFAIQNIPERFMFINELVVLIDSTWSKLAVAPYSGRAALALIMGALLWIPLNHVSLYRNYQVDVVIQRKGDPLEVFIRKAMGAGMPLMLSVKSGTVYIGYVISNFNPVFQTEYLKFLPVVVCSRNSESNTLQVTANYSESFNKVITKIQEIKARLKEKELTCSRDQALHEIEIEEGISYVETVIPVKELESATAFLPEEFRRDGPIASIKKL